MPEILTGYGRPKKALPLKPAFKKTYGFVVKNSFRPAGLARGLQTYWRS
jgi:hypothetical protein